MNIPDDIVQGIILYLKPKDAYNLIITCHNYKKKFNIKKNLINEINYRLYNIFGDKLDQFKKLMKDTQSVISGSFIIQCLLDEYWDCSDIDIYVSKYEPSSKFNIDDFMFHNMKFHGRHENCDRNNDIKWVRTYKPDTIYIIDDYGCYRAIKKNNSKSHYDIQIIGLGVAKTYSSIKTFIDTTFDFDVCKNMYFFKIVRTSK